MARKNGKWYLVFDADEETLKRLRNTTAMPPRGCPKVETLVARISLFFPERSILINR